MKKIILICSIILTVGLFSCKENDDADLETYLIATPIKADLFQFKEEAIAITDPTPIYESGKIYAYKNYIFVNDINRGLHVVDNADPTNPKTISFIKLEGNYDISIKDDRLYADSYGDLVILDISDITNIKKAKRIENAIYQEFWCTVGFDVEWPQADYFDYSNFDSNTEAIVGWEVNNERLSTAEFEERFGYNELALENAAETSNDSFSNTGQGGSLARFKIVGDFLYAVEWSSISVIDISNLDAPKILEDVYTNGVVETIFNQGNMLFVGGTQGMYIYDITAPDKPNFVSEFVHGRACDPVVVDGTNAFITLRSSNTCGETESGLYVVDVADISTPVLTKFYPLNEPYGLGIKDENLFICDGAAGLKVYDKTNVEDLQLVNNFENIVTFDVIPLTNSLLMIGDKTLYQYEYLENDISLLSTLNLN